MDKIKRSGSKMTIGDWNDWKKNLHEAIDSKKLAYVEELLTEDLKDLQKEHSEKFYCSDLAT